MREKETNMSADIANLLHFHVVKGDADSVAKIIEQDGADINTMDRSGATALHMAVTSGDLTMVKLLIAYGAKLNDLNAHECGGLTPLHFAAKQDHIEIARYLLEKKADPNGRSTRGSTALHEAAREGNEHMVRRLIAAKANPSLIDDEGFCPHKCALKAGHPEICAMLPKVKFDMWEHLQSQPDFAEQVARVKASMKKGKKKDGRGKKKGGKKGRR